MQAGFAILVPYRIGYTHTYAVNNDCTRQPAGYSARIFKQSMGARKRAGIGLSGPPELEFLNKIWGLGTE